MAIITVPGMFLTGDHASRPAATAVGKGSIYSCTTHSLIYQSDGAAWSTWATLGSSVADIVDLPTAETDPSLVLAPDGIGGVEFRAETGGGGGALTLVEQHTASNSATLDFTSISSTYNAYYFEMEDIIPATDGAMFTFRCGTGGGPTYDSGSNYLTRNMAHIIGANTAPSNYGRTSTALEFHDDTAHGSLESTATPALFGNATFRNPNNGSGKKMLTWDVTINYYGDGNWYKALGGGIYNSNTAVTAVRFLMSSGNIAGGTVRMYGIEK